MKKLQKLTLGELVNSATVIDCKEADHLRGGDGWVYFNGEYTYMLDDVPCCGSYPSRGSNYGYSGGTLGSSSTGTVGSAMSYQPSYGGGGGGNSSGAVSSINATFCAIVDRSNCDWTNTLAYAITASAAKAVLGDVTLGVSTFIDESLSYYKDKVICETNEMVSKLLHAGIPCDETVHMSVILDSNMDVYIVGSTANFAFSTK